MKMLRAALAILVISTVAACGELPLEPVSADDATALQQGQLGSNN